MGAPEVVLKEGRIRGAEVVSIFGQTYTIFQGIPYATPPVGELRFRDPQPPKPWSDIRDCSKGEYKCAQFDKITKSIVGSDDCLYLHVATTSLTGSRPVMVWIHGGAFEYGYGSFQKYGPDHLIRHDIVLVSMNYRLGILGFLNVDHQVAPGNMGLKDQLAALKWVKENVGKFGGDPNNVTIFGESAGGASVHCHLISPLSKGLFHKAIVQSGVVQNPWSMHGRPVEIAHRMVAALGKKTTDPIEIVEYLRTLPADKIVEAQQILLTHEEIIRCELAFTPSIDDKSPEPFLSESPLEMAADGFDVPVIFGYNSHEGIIFYPMLSEDSFSKLNSNFEIALPWSVSKRCKTPSKVSQVAEEIREFYFGDKKVSKDTIDELIRYFGDIHFVVGTNEIVELPLTDDTRVYLYRFSHEHPKPVCKIMLGADTRGTAHAQELLYIFHLPRFAEHNLLEPNSTERKIADRFAMMWTNFAKTGNPTPQIDELITEIWKPVSTKSKNYLEINKDLSAGTNPDDEVCQFWKRIYALIDDQ